MANAPGKTSTVWLLKAVKGTDINVGTGYKALSPFP